MHPWLTELATLLEYDVGTYQYGCTHPVRNDVQQYSVQLYSGVIFCFGTVEQTTNFTQFATHLPATSTGVRS